MHALLVSLCRASLLQFGLATPAEDEGLRISGFGCDFFLAAFLTFLIFFLGAALLTAIWAFRTPQAAGAALHHKICKTAEACSRVGSQAAVH